MLHVAYCITHRRLIDDLGSELICCDEYDPTNRVSSVLREYTSTFYM